MNINQLWVFYNVAKHKSFTRAAETLFVSQPSISNQLKLFEDTYDLKLFERFGKKIELTSSGEILYSYAVRIFRLVEETEVVINELKATKAGRIRIGAGNTPGTYYLPEIIDSFRRKHPNIEIQMDVGYDLNIIEGILNFKSDLGLIGRSVSHPNIVSIPLWKEELILLVPPNHPFARAETINISLLQDQPFIMAEKGSGVREIAEEILSGMGPAPRVIMELGENEAIKHAVASGLGITIISAMVAKRELETGSLRAVRLSGARIMRQFSIIHHRDKYLSQLIRAFMDEALRFPVTESQSAPEGKAPSRIRKPTSLRSSEQG